MAVDEPSPVDATAFARRASSSSPRGDARRSVETEGIFYAAPSPRGARAARAGRVAECGARDRCRFVGLNGKMTGDARRLAERSRHGARVCVYPSRDARYGAPAR